MYCKHLVCSCLLNPEPYLFQNGMLDKLDLLDQTECNISIFLGIFPVKQILFQFVIDVCSAHLWSM